MEVIVLPMRASRGHLMESPQPSSSTKSSAFVASKRSPLCFRAESSWQSVDGRLRYIRYTTGEPWYMNVDAQGTALDDQAVGSHHLWRKEFATIDEAYQALVKAHQGDPPLRALCRVGGYRIEGYPFLVQRVLYSDELQQGMRRKIWGWSITVDYYDWHAPYTAVMDFHEAEQELTGLMFATRADAAWTAVEWYATQAARLEPSK